MKLKNILGIVIVTAGMLAVTSCTDYDDYNKVPTDVNASAERTLWENISQNSSLSDFANIIKYVGFDDELQQSHFYTVWAPLNGTYDAQSLLNQDKETVLYRFVKSHIAEYNHNVSGGVDERIHALNDKSFSFIGSGEYTYADVSVNQLNLPSVNGVIHTLKGAAAFLPNIYEYIYQAEDADSLQDYFKHYEQVYLDEANSVVGPTVNGKQTYIDSVMITTNLLYRTLGASLAHEDSSYTMLIPTNEAWVKSYERIMPYFNYITTTIAQDMDAATSTTNIPSTTVSIDNVYQADSLTKRAIVNNLVFNNNSFYNRWVENPSEVYTDTLLSTTQSKLSNPREVLDQTINKVKMSNGYSRIVDSLAMHSWESWAPSLSFSPIRYGVSWTGTNHNIILNILNSSESEKETISYLWVEPSSTYSKPELDVKLPNVLSTTYNIYCVIVPPYDQEFVSTSEFRPNQLDFDLSYCDANGKLATTLSGSGRTAVHLASKLENDPTRIDTMFVGTFTFPVAYRGLGEKIYPNLKITTDFNVFDRTAMEQYTRDLRIASIILRPVEQDEYEATKEN